MTPTEPDNQTVFARAIDLAVTMCMDRQMHPSEMAEALKRKAEELAGAGQ